MEVTKKGKNLLIEIALEKPRISASGKTLLVATSGGFKSTGVTVAGKPVSVVVNATIPTDNATKKPDTKAGVKGGQISKPQADGESDGADEDE